MNSSSKFKEFFLFFLFIIIVISFFGFMILSTNIKINRELNWSNVFDKMSLSDLALSWPGLVFIGLGVYVAYLLFSKK